MKKLLLQVFLVCQLPLFLTAQEAGESIEDAFRRGLSAEEVDSDLETAKAAYEEVIEQFNSQKRLVATATFRLAEVYRKQAITAPSGNHEDLAAREYERIIREFPAMEDLVKLSHENLISMGKPVPTPGSTNEESKIIAELKKWKETSPDKLREEPTPLYEAAKENHLRVAEFLIAQKVNLDRGSNDSPLAIAANQGHLSMVKLLLEAGANPLMQTGQPAIHYALCGNRVEVVRVLIEKEAHLGVFDTFGNSPLQALVAMPEYKDALHQAVLADKQQLVYIRMLISGEADVNALNLRNGDSVLTTAVQKNLPWLVDLLLEEKADPNLTGTQLGETALIHAVKDEDINILRKLLEADADVNQADNKGNAPLHYAILGKAKKELVQALIDAGADPNQRFRKDGWAPLHFWANEPRDYEVGRLLYRAGANPIAVAKGFPKDIDTRSLDQIDPRSLDIEKNTPLHILSDRRRDDIPIVREFFEHGIQTLPTDDFGGGVWFLMPRSDNRKPNPDTAKAPTDLIPNLFPIYQRSELDLPPPGLSDFIVQAFDDPYGDTKQKLPNLEKLRILRQVKKGDGKAAWKTINVFYKDLAEAAKPGSDPVLQWGDVVLFDLESDRKTGNWKEFEEPIKLFLSQSSRVAIQLQFADIVSPVTFLPESEYSTTDVAGVYQTPYSDSSVRALKNIRLLATSREDLDFTSLQVIRSGPDGDQEFKIDLESDTPDSEFFLESQDKVIVPRKPEHNDIALRNRMDGIWISQPGNHLIKMAIHKRRFESRGVEALPLARVLASHYSSSGDTHPCPDFTRVRLIQPDGKVGETRILNLQEEPDLAIPWGTIVEIPMKKGASPGEWNGLSEAERTLLTDLSKVKILLRPEGIQARSVETGYTFPEYERMATGELVRKSRQTSDAFPTPEFWSVLGDQFRGEDVKWDGKRIILISGKDRWTFSTEAGVPDFLDGDVLEFFRAL